MTLKSKVVPMFFAGRNEREVKEYDQQLERLNHLYKEEAEFLPPLAFGSEIPKEADVIVFPQLFGAIFREKERLCQIELPIMIITSEFGTVEMWDWEIVAWLRDELHLNVFFPYSTEMAQVIFRSLAVKKQMTQGMKFLMFQDDPGEGMQAYLFKRFYWWDKDCTTQIENAFGIKIIYKSWKLLNEYANQIPDEDARALWKEREVPNENVPESCILKAVKIYMAVKKTMDEEGEISGVGANCLNESFLSCSTPCLAWNWLYEYDHTIWACEGDTVTLISKFVMYHALKKPMMMTNIYPFLVGMAALKHEKIKEFPQVEDPDQHALGVHCGYFGFAPQSFCSRWVMRPKVLEIVDKDAIVIDCEMEKGLVTMAKFRPDMRKITIIEAEIEDYVQYEGSDCRNGALIRFTNGNGHKVMESLSSHHAIIIKGHVTHLLQQMARVYEVETEII